MNPTCFHDDVDDASSGAVVVEIAIDSSGG
jgi:hypothetical protein